MKTERLVLRQWNGDDLQDFSKMCGDREVMEFFPKLLTQDESRRMGEKIKSLIAERGWGLWAVEAPSQRKFMGFVGLNIPTDCMPFSPCVEVGWRLARRYWGMGYATEAAAESLRYAFNHLGLDEVVSFTTVSNIRSQAVMKKLGMTYASNFMHPELDPSNPLCEHVLYKINRSQWENHAL